MITREEILRNWIWKPAKIVYRHRVDPHNKTTNIGYIIATINHKSAYFHKVGNALCIMMGDRSWNCIESPDDLYNILSIENYKCEYSIDKAIADVNNRDFLDLLEKPRTGARSNTRGTYLILD